jgi:hypothetical protein
LRREEQSRRTLKNPLLLERRNKNLSSISETNMHFQICILISSELSRSDKMGEQNEPNP